MSTTRFSALLFCLLSGWFFINCTIPAPGGFGEPAETAPGEVAFHLAGPNEAALVVPVKINGQGPFHFVLDTGATFTCVDRGMVERLQLPKRSGQFAGGAGIRSQGNVELVTIETLEVGSARATGLAAAVLDLGNLRSLGLEIDGLVGLNFLKAYRVTLDFERRALRLEKPRRGALTSRPARINVTNAGLFRMCRQRGPPGSTFPARATRPVIITES